MWMKRASGQASPCPHCSQLYENMYEQSFGFGRECVLRSWYSSIGRQERVCGKIYDLNIDISQFRGPFVYFNVVKNSFEWFTLCLQILFLFPGNLSVIFIAEYLVKCDAAHFIMDTYQRDLSDCFMHSFTRFFSAFLTLWNTSEFIFMDHATNVITFWISLYAITRFDEVLIVTLKAIFSETHYPITARELYIC